MKKTILTTALAGFAAAALALGSAGAAQANTTDAAFIAHLNKQGIDSTTYRSVTPDYLIRIGHVICNEIDGGTTVKAVTKHVYSRTRLSQYDAGYLVGASVAAYCSWNMRLVTG